MPESRGDGVEQAALAYLEAHTVLTLATNGPDGVWAAALFYASKDYDLYFLSARHTRHAQNLAIDPRAAGTIQENYHNWKSIKGIQFEGEVTLLSGVHEKLAISIYARKFPLIKDGGGVIAAALKKVSWYCLRPDRLYMIDNSLGFGHRDEVNLRLR